MTSAKEPRALADLHGGTILASVELPTAPDRVFKALTTEEVTSWWGDDGTYRTTGWKSDLRVGGTWKAEGISADGQPFSVQGEYLQIDAPTLLTLTWRADWDGGETTVLTYQLEAIESGTRLTLRHDGFQGRAQSCSGHAAGWEQVLRWLADHVSPPAESRRKAYYLGRLIPPRPSFPFDMTRAEREVMDRHVGYWRDLQRGGEAVVFGPVADPTGPWGLVVVRVDSEQRMLQMRDGDPAIAGRIGMRYEMLPMLDAVS